MHKSAMENAHRFFSVYGKPFLGRENVRVVEIGAQDVNGTLRDACPKGFSYTGVDFCAGKGVDVVLDDPYQLPFADAEIDIVVSSSCFEHSEMFWLLFLEIMRVLKPAGLFYLNAPSNGSFHRYPVDCWRFYPDSGRALANWARRNKHDALCLESYTSAQVKPEVWNDYVAVFLKDERFLGDYPERIVESLTNFNNGVVHGREGVANFSHQTEDYRRYAELAGAVRSIAKDL